MFLWVYRPIYNISKGLKKIYFYKKQTKLIDPDNGMVVTKGKGSGGVVKSKGVKYVVIEDLTLGGGHTIPYTDDAS